jgi:hypothetical protein
MIGLLCLFLALLASPFKARSQLEAENAARRHQLIVLRRKTQRRVRLTNNDIRTHRSLDKDAPVSRSVQQTGIISSPPILGGLHRHYARV